MLMKNVFTELDARKQLEKFQKVPRLRILHVS